MPFPATRAAMEEKGYYRNCYTRCRGCNRPMEGWYSPAGKWMPMDPMANPDSPAVAHFATCPEVNRFRKEPSKCISPISTSQDSPSSQPSLFSSPASDLSNVEAACEPPDEKPKNKGEH